MDSVELLVHISAPGTIHHDKGVLAVVQGVMHFKAGKVTKVMDQDSDIELSPADDAQNELSSHLTAVQRCLKRRAGSLDSNSQINTNRDFKRSKTEPNGYLNPPYRRPWRGTREHVQELQTPLPPPRPQTAPQESIGTIQVPRTNTERRRAYSDSFQNTNTRASNSQEADQVDDSSEGRISSPLGAKQIQIVQRLSQTSSEDGSNPSQAVSSSATNTILPQKATSRSQHSSSTVTASPSEPMEGIDGQRAYSSQPAPEKSPSIVVLSSGSSYHQSSLSPNGTRRKEARLQREEQSTTSEDMPVKNFSRIDFLSEEVVAPQPETGSMGSMGSNGHVSQHLQELYDVLPLKKLFRPIQITRDIKSLERGYWLMQITIVPDTAVQEARSSPSNERKIQRYTDRFSAATAQERLSKYWGAKAAGKLRNFDYGDDDAAVGLWTEQEFIEFWNGFSDFIKDGKAGWAIRMVRDEVEGDAPGDDCQFLRVRIFTWGETIAHIYLAIWVCSDKLSIRIPMEWIAGDGSTVIVMSGKKKYGGMLKPFARKGSSGKEGCWGVSGD